jgi:hypothetical protein
MAKQAVDAPSSAGRMQAGYERVFGTPNDAVNAWGIMRKDHGKWVRMVLSDEQGIGRKEWPLDTLTPDHVRETWGPGEYRCHWFVHDPENDDPKRRWVAAGVGTSFSVRELAQVVEAPAPAAPLIDPLASIPGIAPAVALMGFINQQAQGQMTGMAQLAQIMLSSSARQGTDPALLQILQNQNASNQRIEALLTQLLSDEPEPEPSAAAGVAGVAARAAARPLFKPGQPMGEAIKAALTNHFVENPGALVDIVKAVPTALDAISRIGKPPPPRPRAMVPQQAQAPVTIIQKPEPPPPPLKRRPPPGPGLNAQLATAPAPSSPPAGNA